MKPDVIELLDELAADRRYLYGYQIVVQAGDETMVDHAGGVDGLGRAMKRDSMTAMYCSAKSLVAVAIAQLVARGELSWNDRAGDVIDGCSPYVAACSVESLLRHRSGLTQPNLIEATTLSPERRLSSALLQAPRVPPLDIGESHYTEAAAWLVLGAVVASCAGVRVHDFVQGSVIATLRANEDFDLPGEQRSRRRIAVSLRGDRPMPLLLEDSARFTFGDNPGYGGFCTMRGQVALHAAIMSAACGSTSSVGLDAQTAQELIGSAPTTWDATFQRHCAFSRGFASDLANHGFPGLSTRSFGQAGLLGMTTVASDPETQMTAAIHLNGLLDAETSVGWLRPLVWQRIDQLVRQR